MIRILGFLWQLEALETIGDFMQHNVSNRGYYYKRKMFRMNFQPDFFAIFSIFYDLRSSSKNLTFSRFELEIFGFQVSIATNWTN
jgi:hypothetical protein